MTDANARQSTYQAIIDQLVNETRTASAFAKCVADDARFPVESEQLAFNNLLSSLTPAQRLLLSEVLLQERHSAVHDVLAAISWWVECRGVSFTVNGQSMPVGLSGMGLHGDYVGRVNGWEWL